MSMNAGARVVFVGTLLQVLTLRGGDGSSLPGAIPMFLDPGARTAASSGQDTNWSTLLPLTGLTATAISTTEVDLTWQDSNGAGNGYSVTVDRQVASGSWTNISASASSPYRDTGCVPNTSYTYRLTAHNSKGDSPPAFSNQALTYPDVPANLRKTSSTSSTLTIGWDETNSSNAPITYTIQWRQLQYGEYWVNEPAVTCGANSYKFTGLSPDSTYAFKVMATNATGSSAYCGELQFITGPAAPQYLYAYVMSSTAIQLYWNDPTGGTGTFTLWRQTGSGAAVDAGDYPAGKTNTTDTGLTPFTTYTYTVVAHNANGNSDPSPPCNATTWPGAPTNLTATAGPGGITLNWTAAPGATGYHVLTSTTAGGPYGGSYNVPAGATTYLDSNVYPNTTYYYVVASLPNSNDQPQSNEAFATSYPGRPTGLNAQAISSTEIDLTWSAPVGGASAYKVQQQNPDGSWTQIGSSTTAATNGSPYKVTSLSPNTQYTFQVIANNGNDSTPSDPASATTWPAAPTNLTATPGVGQVLLNWTAATGAAGYVVGRSTTQGGNGGQYPAINAGAPVTDTTFIDTNVTGGTTYYYVVAAVPAGAIYNQQGPNSNEASATPVNGTFTLQVKSLAPGAPTDWASTATVAAGAKDAPEHKASILITAVGNDGGLLVGYSVPSPTYKPDGLGAPDTSGGDAVITLDQNGITDANGQVTGTYRSSNVVDVSVTTDDVIDKCVTLKMPGTASSGTATIVQAWVDLRDGYRWGGDDDFEYGAPSLVTYSPTLRDDSQAPITRHVFQFVVERVDVLHTDAPGVPPRLIVYSTDPNAAQDYGLDAGTEVHAGLANLNQFAIFDADSIFGDSQGLYQSYLTVLPQGLVDDISTVYYNANDLSTWSG